MLKNKFKTVSVLLIVCVMLISGGIISSAEERPVEEPTVTVFVDGELIEFDVDPILENGRTLVPMRYIFEALGAEVNWIDETQTAVAVKGETRIEIAVNSTEMLKNGEVVVLDVPAKLLNDRTLVPVRAVSEGLGANVDWDEELYQVIITSDVEDEDAQTVQPENADGETYDMSVLSENDMELLKSTYSDFRYSFEQYAIVQNIAGLSDVDWGKVIGSKAEELKLMIDEIWNRGMISVIIQIQTQSEDTYMFSELTEEKLINAYMDILGKAELKASDIFESSYVTTPGGKDVFLITFGETDTRLACKYAAIVADGSEARYFTAESDELLAEMGVGSYFLCEVIAEGRSNFGTIGNSEKDFLAGIDSVLNK